MRSSIHHVTNREQAAKFIERFVAKGFALAAIKSSVEEMLKSEDYEVRTGAFLVLRELHRKIRNDTIRLVGGAVLLLVVAYLVFMAIYALG